MPDAHGNFKGISVPAATWSRIFGKPRPVRDDEAKALGCTCRWWARGTIIEFDPKCPIYDQHYGQPNRDKKSTNK